MPYKDPERQKAAKRASAQRARQRRGAERVASAVNEDRVLPEPPEHDELVRLLGVQARLGSVRAIELMLKMEAPADDAASDPLAEFDELAERRRRAA